MSPEANGHKTYDLDWLISVDDHILEPPNLWVDRVQTVQQVGNIGRRERAELVHQLRREAIEVGFHPEPWTGVQTG